HANRIAAAERLPREPFCVPTDMAGTTTEERVRPRVPLVAFYRERSAFPEIFVQVPVRPNQKQAPDPPSSTQIRWGMRPERYARPAPILQKSWRQPGSRLGYARLS